MARKLKFTVWCACCGDNLRQAESDYCEECGDGCNAWGEEDEEENDD